MSAGSKTLIRQRITGVREYKVPETDGRRARYALPKVTVSRADYALIQTTVRVAVCEVLRVFRVERSSKHDR